MKQKLFNPISYGCSGKFGQHVVLRVRNGQTLICAAPPTRPGKGTPAQEAARDRFRSANKYGLMAMVHPNLLPLYQAASTSAKSVHNLAVSDYFHAPEITSLDISGYHGLPGNIINVTAIDNFMVKSVTISIYDEAGLLIESGMALQAGAEQWSYTVAKAQNHSGRYRICASAKDLPGNETVKEVITEQLEIVSTPKFNIPCPSLAAAAGGGMIKKVVKRARIIGKIVTTERHILPLHHIKKKKKVGHPYVGSTKLWQVQKTDLILHPLYPYSQTGSGTEQSSRLHS